MKNLVFLFLSCFILLVFTDGFNIGRKGSQVRLFRRDKEGRWPPGNSTVIYYTTSGLSPTLNSALNYAVDYMNNVSCVQWVPWNPRFGINETYKQVFEYSPNETCRSFNGYVDYQQLTTLGDSCLKDRNQGQLRTLLLRHMMTVLGFSLEHLRPDRDCYIKFRRSAYFSNEHFYEKRDPIEWADDFPYDYSSVMHHERNDHLIRPREDIVNNDRIGRANGTLSKSDIEKLNHIYCGGPSFCEQEGNLDTCTGIETYKSLPDQCTQLFF